MINENHAKNRQNRNTGYTANILRSSDTKVLINPTDANNIESNLHNVDHPKLKATKTNLIGKYRNDLVNATNNAAKLIGNTQYPNTHTD